MTYRVHLKKAQITCMQCYSEREREFDFDLAQRFHQDAINLLQKSIKAVEEKYSAHPNLGAIISDLNWAGDMCEKCIRAPNENDSSFSDYLNIGVSDYFSASNKLEED